MTNAISDGSKLWDVRSPKCVQKFTWPGSTFGRLQLGVDICPHFQWVLIKVYSLFQESNRWKYFSIFSCGLTIFSNYFEELGILKWAEKLHYRPSMTSLWKTFWKDPDGSLKILSFFFRWDISSKRSFPLTSLTVHSESYKI